MFQDFAKRKFDDYLALLEFPAGRMSFDNLKNSSLPPFIISFIEYYIPNKNIPLDKKDFEEILNKAIVFNINYIIKPKNTIIKFLFGELETRPVRFIEERLRYFQFYGYYTSQIEDFINFNSLEVVSFNQIDHLLSEVNRKIYEEITVRGSDANRMNLVKLLYYFFHDLGDNNPINIKLPRKILSVFFLDKGYEDIKKRVDGFFSDDIFIQEAIELMNPGTVKSARELTDVGVSDDQIKDIISKAKTSLINKESLNKEVEKILLPLEQMPEEIPDINIEIIRERESRIPEIKKKKLIISEDLYSDDLMFAAQFNNLTLPVQLSSEEKRARLIDDLFCEKTYKKKILKVIFNRDESGFKDSVSAILETRNWAEASELIEEYFNKFKVNYFSEEAVKFVDIM
ncbi:MAG: hypothetical protein ACHQIH_03765, partial [Ignavibacteria bacterium]